MAENTKIEWCHHSWSPWVGCAKVSAGCKHCYAEALTKRSGLAIWGQDGTRRVTSEAYWKKPQQWAKQAREKGERYRIFPSMCDVFEDRPELIEPRARMWGLIKATPELDWLLLTKRPENLPRMLPWMNVMPATEPGVNDPPWPNVWIGASVENQEAADERIPHLLRVPATVRFLSCEPLFGPVDLTRIEHIQISGDSLVWTPQLDWVIVGGESGHSARPMNPQWARDLRGQCAARGIAYFHKQNGEFASVSEVAGPGRHHHFEDGRTVRRVGKKAAGRLLDGDTYDQFPEAKR